METRFFAHKKGSGGKTFRSLPGNLPLDGKNIFLQDLFLALFATGGYNTVRGLGVFPLLSLPPRPPTHLFLNGLSGTGGSFFTPFFKNQFYKCQGDRIGRLSIRFAVASEIIRSLIGSHLIFRSTIIAILPRWHGIAE